MTPNLTIHFDLYEKGKSLKVKTQHISFLNLNSNRVSRKLLKINIISEGENVHYLRFIFII